MINKVKINLVYLQFLLFLLSLSFFFKSFVVFAGQENIRFNKIALEQGLSQETILSAYQDDDGFMWFGTQEGLNRFDGYQFKVFTHSERQNNSLSSDWIYALNADNKGHLWIGTINGLNIFDKATQSFSHFTHNPLKSNSLSQNNIRVIFKDADNNMWLGTHDGLSKFNPQSNDFSNYKSSPTSPDKISSIVQDNLGYLWIGTDGNGLLRFDPTNETFTNISQNMAHIIGFGSKKIMSLYIDETKRLWVGKTEGGVSVFDLGILLGKSKTKKPWIPSQLSSLIASHIYEDKVGTIWIATDIGLYRYKQKTQDFQAILYEADNAFSLSSNRVSHLFQDRGGVFWVGTYSGLNKWNTATAKFDYLRVTSDAASSLTDNFIHTFIDAGDDKLWIATFNGLNLLDTKTGLIQHYQHDDENINSLRSNKVMALYAKNSNELWIGYRDKGLSLLNRNTGVFTHFLTDPDDENSLGSNGITFIQGADQGKLWIGVFGAGINLFDPLTSTFSRFSNESSAISNKVVSMHKDSQGLLWLGTLNSGINIFNPSENRSIAILSNAKDIDSLGSNLIWSIHEDKNNNLWFGTQSAGLNKLSAENRFKGQYSFEKISRDEGLPSNAVYGIVEDSKGFLWLSTNRGITKFNPKTKELLNYDSSHGLQGNEFNSGAYYKTRNGKIYFGGTNGVTAFYPEDISPNSHVPPVVLTKFQKLNEVVSIDSLTPERNNIQISHKDYLIAFEFAGLDYASPSNNRYKYKLEGFDEQWIEAADVRKATYTNLPSGSYIFRVKASNNDGIWNEQGTTVALTVLPAPWYSWWAYLIYGLISLAILYRIYRSYVNKLLEETNYRKKLESEVESRTVELSSANEQLLNASITDQLTGLNNRRYLDSIVEQQCSSVLREFEELAKAKKSNSESGPRLFFLMFDLDGFKPINDTYGHGAGDKVIVQVGEVLRTVCRKSDTVIRWGGDEFLVMGRVEDPAEVEILAERLRSRIAENGFDIDLKQKMYLSCSIGYSMYPFSHHYPNALNWEQVHLLADNALYKSKEAGRNKWTGILQSIEKPPASVMGTLAQNIELVIEDNHAQVKQSN